MSAPVIPSKEPSKAWPEADYFEANPEGFSAYSWTPAPVGDTASRSTQVHLHGIASFGRVAWRFKSPRMLDELIDMLVKHREDVWGKR
jgi:hypothetical protein